MYRYPLVYYTLVGLVMRVGLAVGLTGFEVLILARVFSGVMCLAVVGVVMAVAGRYFRWPAVVMAVSFAVVPLSWFLFSSVNPNGLEMVLAMLLSVLVVAVRSSMSAQVMPGKALRYGLPVVALLLAWTRPVGIVWAGAIVLLLLVPARGSRRPVFFRMGVGHVVATVIAAVAGAGWFLYQASASPQDVSTVDTEQDWGAIPVSLRLAVILLRFGDMLQSGFGTMGWLDTPMPTLLFVVWLLVAAVMITAMTVGAVKPSTSPRHVALALLVGMLAVAVESWMAAFGWQGRYWYPAIMASLVLMIPAMQGKCLADSVVDRFAAGAVVVTQTIVFIGLMFNINRYKYGYHVTYERFIDLPYPWREAAWRPAGGDSLQLVAAIGGMLLIVLSLYLASRKLTRVSSVEGCIVDVGHAGAVHIEDHIGEGRDAVPACSDGRDQDR